MIDQTLTAASNISFVPAYTPPRPLAEVVGQLDADLAPIQKALTGLDENLQRLTTAGGGLTSGLDQLVAHMGDINRALADADALVEQYLATADRAAAVVTDSRNDLDRDLTALRWLMLPAASRWP